MKTSEELRKLAKNVEDYVRGEQVVFTNGGITASGLRVAADEIDRLTSLVADLQADARRYRCLRNQRWPLGGSALDSLIDTELNS